MIRYCPDCDTPLDHVDVNQYLCRECDQTFHIEELDDDVPEGGSSMCEYRRYRAVARNGAGDMLTFNQAHTLSNLFRNILNSGAFVSEPKILNRHDVAIQGYDGEKWVDIDE